MPNGMLDPRVTSGTVNENRPAMAIDSNGIIFIAYQYEYSTSDHDIRVAKSTDAGYTWTIQSVIADTYDQLSPSIAIDRTNNYIYIGYRDNQYFKYAKSTDGGASWTNYGISSWTWYASASWPSIAAHNNYVWLACQYAWTSSDDDVRYVYSTNGGSSWFGYYSLAATTKNERFPALAMTSSRVGIAYQYEYSSSDSDVYYKYNAGWASTSWTAANIATSSVNERWPSASASPVDSYLYVGYTYAFSTSDDDIRCAWSSNGGTSWGATGVSVAASGYNDRYPSTAIDPVTRTRVYISHYTGNAHIYYAFSTNNGQSWSNYIQATDQANAVDAQHTTSMAFRSWPRISWQDNRNAATHGLDIYYSTTGQNWTIQTAPAVPPGLTFYVGGTPYTTPQTFAWPHGYTTTISTDSPQTLASPETRYVWNNWSQGGGISHTIVVTGTGDVTDQANFDTQYQVTLAAQTATGGTPMSASNYVQTWGTGPGTAAKLRWEEISTTGTEVTSWYSVDDGFATSATSIGFSFPYYGGNFTEFVPATNGYIALGSGAANQYAPYDVVIPYDTSIRPYMANTVYPFSDDLYWTSGTSKVYYQTFTNPQRLVIQYNNIDSFSPRGTLHTFETILYATGEIRLLYKTVGYEPGDIGLEGSSNLYYVNAPATAIGANSTYVFQNIYRSYDGQANALWVDGGGTAFVPQASSLPSSTERWQTNQATSFAVTAPATHTVTYYNQLWTEMTATTAPGGLPMTAENGVTVQWLKFGTVTTPPSPGVVYDGFSVTDWADRASNVTFGAASTGSGTSERWQANAAGTQPTYVVETPGALFSPQYWHQFKPTITLTNTAPDNTVSTEARTFFGASALESGLYAAWSNWCDRSSTLTFSEYTTQGWVTTDTRSWQVLSAFEATITYVLPDTTPPVGSISINNDAVYTNSQNVTLYLTAEDPESGVAGMRFSNNGVDYTTWEPFASTKAWTLTAGDETKTVWVQYKNGWGLVSTYSDDIILDMTPPAAPTLISPADLSYTSDQTPTFDWSDVSDPSVPVTYRLEIDDADDFLTPVIVKMDLLESAYTLSGTPPEYLTDGQYWWRVFAKDGADNPSPASSVWSFTVDIALPTIPTFELYDLTSSHTDWTNSQTMGVTMTEDGTGSPVIRWLLKENTTPPTVEEMLAAQTARPTQYTTSSPDGQIAVYAWVMDSAQNISAAAQYAIGLDTILPFVDTCELSDVTSQSDEYTDSLTVTLTASGYDANPIVRWMFINDPASLEFPPTESEMWSNGLTEPPSTWEFPPETPPGDVVLGAWAMDAAGNISPCQVACIEYVFMSGPGIVSPPDGLFARPYVPLRLEVVGLEEPITWECDAGTVVGESPWAWFHNIGPRIYSIIASGFLGGEPVVMRTKIVCCAYSPGGQPPIWPIVGGHHNLTGSHHFDIPVARTYSGKGFLLNLSLSYNSHAFEAREYMGFSYNWTHSYEIYVHHSRNGRL
ncbi:MAG: sialidase family protein, partial [Planctomycetota bacterium]|nr:sialidase family protein [Planctomycetota bacterium]